MGVKGLGKGLDLLIPNGELLQEEFQNSENAVMVKLMQVEPSRTQPRKKFEKEALQELANSIQKFGVLQPILVCKKEDYYEIIAGERRWRAAKLAGLKEIPVIIKTYSQEEVLEISLIENIQRENLNPIEEAYAYQNLITKFHLKQDEIAQKVSKSRTVITNSLRLLKLCDEVKNMLIEEKITMGHARTLLVLEDSKDQFLLAQKIAEEKLSVRETEKLVKNKIKTQKKKEKKNQETLNIYETMIEKLKEKFGTKVSILEKANGTGKIEIEFYNREDLNRLFELLEDEKYEL